MRSSQEIFLNILLFKCRCAEARPWRSQWLASERVSAAVTENGRNIQYLTVEPTFTFVYNEN